jgi:hypothetical protein
MKGAAGAAKAGKTQTAERSVPITRQAPAAGSAGSFQSLQKTAGNRAVSQLMEKDLPPTVQAAMRGPSRPLDAGTRTLMEARFAFDFGAVRVHDGAAAGDSAERLTARAYTLGQDIFFGRGHYAPETSEGKRLLAHELAHVVQQSRGGATQAPGAEKEAARAGRLAAGGVTVAVSGSAGVGIQCELYTREQAESRLKQLQVEIEGRERFFAERGVKPESDLSYQSARQEYQELEAQLKKNAFSSNRLVPPIFGKQEPREVQLPAGMKYDPNAARPQGPPAPPPKGERTLPLSVNLEGKSIVLAEENIPDPVRRHRVHNLKVDIKALEDQEQAARWSWQQALSEWKVVRWTADQIAGAHPPSFELLAAILITTRQAMQALTAGNLDEAERLVQRAQRQVVDARREWHRYRNKNIAGAESLETGLEYTRDAAFLTLAILAPGAGAAGAWIATGAPIAAEVARTLVQVGLGDKIDWTQKVVSILINVLLARFGGPVTGRMMKGVALRLGTKTVAQQYLLKLIQSEILHVGSVFLNTAAEQALALARGEGKDVTWQKALEILVARITDPKGQIMMLLVAAAETGATRLPVGKEAKAPESPEGAKRPKQAGDKQEPARKIEEVKEGEPPAAAKPPEAAGEKAPASKKEARAEEAKPEAQPAPKPKPEAAEPGVPLAKPAPAQAPAAAEPAATVKPATAEAQAAPVPAKPKTTRASKPKIPKAPKPAKPPEPAKPAGPADVTKETKAPKAPRKKKAPVAPTGPVKQEMRGTTNQAKAAKRAAAYANQYGDRLDAGNGGLEELFNRSAHLANPKVRRAASTELGIIERYLKRGSPDGRQVRKLTVIASKKGTTSPDYRVDYTDGSSEYVEATAATGAPEGRVTQKATRFAGKGNKQSEGGLAARSKRGANITDVKAALARKAVGEGLQVAAAQKSSATGGATVEIAMPFGAKPGVIDKAMKDLGGNISKDINGINFTWTGKDANGATARISRFFVRKGNTFVEQTAPAAAAVGKRIADPPAQENAAPQTRKRIEVPEQPSAPDPAEVEAADVENTQREEQQARRQNVVKP